MIDSFKISVLICSILEIQYKFLKHYQKNNLLKFQELCNFHFGLVIQNSSLRIFTHFMWRGKTVEKKKKKTIKGRGHFPMS